MSYPRVRSAKAINDHILLIEFDNSEQRIYDVRPLLEREMFLPLSNEAFFKNVQVDTGGYAIYWDENIDLSEYELWIHGKPVEI